MQLEVKGTVKEILFSNDYHEQFLLEGSDYNLVCTIRNKRLRDLIEEGDKIEAKGRLTVVTKKKRLKKFRDNIFYINQLKIKK